MKKSLIALAVLAAAGVASAQSSVTLFGIVDANLNHGSGSLSKKTSMGNSGIASSQIGFRGVEDLGGGMSASFWLEAGVNNDNGTGAGTNTNNQASGAAAAAAGGQGLTFNRRSTVSLAGGFGEVRLGRHLNPQFMNLTAYDPFGTNGVGTSQNLGSIITGVTSVRSSNMFQYFTPALGGFSAQVAYYLGENNKLSTPAIPDTSKDGKGYGLRVGYAAGPISAHLAVSKTEYAAGDVKQNNAGFSWNFGMVKPMIQISRDSNGAVDGKGVLVGATVPVGPGEIRAAYSRYETDATAFNPETKKLALGYVHNLSKRTAVYATIARVKNGGGATAALNGSTTAANGSSNGYDLGVKHSF
ncbi:MAG TPA: porin [Ramlibacter sp.]|nr:porin [Ramlibacter sp.]